MVTAPMLPELPMLMSASLLSGADNRVWRTKLQAYVPQLPPPAHLSAQESALDRLSALRTLGSATSAPARACLQGTEGHHTENQGQGLVSTLGRLFCHSNQAGACHHHSRRFASSISCRPDWLQVWVDACPSPAAVDVAEAYDLLPDPWLQVLLL